MVIGATVHAAIVPTHWGDERVLAALFILDTLGFIGATVWTLASRPHWQLVSAAMLGGTVAGYAFYLAKGWETADPVGMTVSLIELSGFFLLLFSGHTAFTDPGRRNRLVLELSRCLDRIHRRDRGCHRNRCGHRLRRDGVSSPWLVGHGCDGRGLLGRQALELTFLNERHGSDLGKSFKYDDAHYGHVRRRYQLLDDYAGHGHFQSEWRNADDAACEFDRSKHHAFHALTHWR